MVNTCGTGAGDMFSKPHIVQFKDGKYAVRKKILFMYVYRSLYSNWWWRAPVNVDPYCKTEHLHIAENVLAKTGKRKDKLIDK